MIDPRGRLWAGSGSLLNGGPYTWHITDFDQRRYFADEYAPHASVENVEDTEDICMVQLQKHVDHLGPDVFCIRFSEPNGPITLLTDREHDVIKYVNNYPLSALDLQFPVKTIYLPSLTELDRLGPGIDLVSYREPPFVAGTALTTRKVVFKYWFFGIWHVPDLV